MLLQVDWWVCSSSWVLLLIWWCGCNARIHILCDSLGKKEHQFMSPSKHKVRCTCTNRNVVTLCTVLADSSCWYFHTTTCLITYTRCNTTKAFLQFKVLKCHDHSMCLGYFVICPMIFSHSCQCHIPSHKWCLEGNVFCGIAYALLDILYGLSSIINYPKGLDAIHGHLGFLGVYISSHKEVF
jgi:hypothetical protein